MEPISDEFMHEMLGRARSYTAVLLKVADGADSVPEMRSIVWEHGRRNFALRAAGRLAIVCPVADDSGLAGLGIFDGSPEEVAAIMDGDPAVEAGIFTYEVHPVRGFPGDALPGQP